MLSHSVHTASTLACANGLMGLLGFVYSEDKLEAFDYSAEILGIVLDLRKISEGRIAISNKPTRVDELKVVLDSILETRSIIRNRLPSVLGKLQYADSHVWGRAGRLALADLREIGHTSPAAVALDDTQVESFKFSRTGCVRVNRSCSLQTLSRGPRFCSQTVHSNMMDRRLVVRSVPFAFTPMAGPKFSV